MIEQILNKVPDILAKVPGTNVYKTEQRLKVMKAYERLRETDIEEWTARGMNGIVFIRANRNFLLKSSFDRREMSEVINAFIKTRNLNYKPLELVCFAIVSSNIRITEVLDKTDGFPYSDIQLGDDYEFFRAALKKLNEYFENL